MNWLASLRSLLPRQPSGPMAPRKKAANPSWGRKAKKQKHASGQENQFQYEALAICFSSACLRMKDLAIVSACSKVCKQQVQLYLQQNMTILPHAVKQVSLAQQPHMSVKWLCSMVGLPAIESQREALVSMSNVSPEAATHILDAGLQISYTQLVSAARQRVPGSEVWVRSHFSGLPTIVEAVCTHNVVELKRLLPTLQPHDVIDCLYLATNIRPSASYCYPICATLLLEHIVSEPKLMQHLSQHLQAADIEHLLATAILRRQEYAHLRRLCTLSEASSLGCSVVTSLLQLAVSNKSYLAVRLLAQLPAAKLINAEAAAKLVLITVQSRDASTLIELKDNIPSVEGLSSADIACLIWAALPLSSAVTICNMLCSFPAADSLSAVTLASMMKAAMNHQKCMVVGTMCKKHAAAEMSPAVVAELILHSLQVAGPKDYGVANRCADALCGLQGAEQLSPTVVKELIRAALHSHDEDTSAAVVCQLCQLPGAHALEPSDVAGLLKLAVQVSDIDVLVEIFTLPAAAEMQQRAVVDILQLCLQLKYKYKLLLLLGHEAAQRLDAQAVAALLAAGTQMNQQVGYCSCGGVHCGSGLLERICDLPAARQVSSAAAAGLLRLAVQVEDDNALKVLCKNLPAVQQLEGSVVGSLLREVVTQGGRPTSAAETLCGLPGTAGLKEDVVSSLLLDAEQQCNTCLRASLYKLLVKQRNFMQWL